MNTPRSLRLALARSLLGTALLTSTAFGLTPADFETLRAKADRGNAIAQYNLGLAYANRDEPIYDPVQAYAWLSLAAANGTNGKVLGQLTEQLTSEQIEAGKRRLAALTASPVVSAPPADSPIRAIDTPEVTAPAPVTSPVQSVAPDPEQKKLSAELAAAWKENELLKAGLNSRLADATKRIAIAEAALASKDKEIAALHVRLTEAAAEPEAMDAAIRALRDERNQLQSATDGVRSDITALRAALEEANLEKASLREQLAGANASLAEARRALSLAEAEAASLKAAADRASAERLAVAAQLESVTTELAAVKASMPPPETDQERMEKAADEGRARKATDAAATFEADRDRLAAVVKTLTEERDALAAQVAAARAAVPAEPAPEVVAAPIPLAPTAPVAPVVPDAEAKLAELESAKADSDTKLEAALRSFTLQQGEIERLQKALASIDEERAAAVTKLDAANAELDVLRPRAATAEAVAADAERLRTELAAAKEYVANQASALELANRNLTDARQTIDAATAELVATRDQLRQTQAQSAASANEVHQLKTRLALAGSMPAANAPSRPGALPAVTLTPPPPPATPTVPAAPIEAPAGPRVHTVASGDSLSKISKQYYGTANRWNEILQANQDVIRNPDSLALGTRLRIP